MEIIHEVRKELEDRRRALVLHAEGCGRCGLPAPGVIRVRRCPTGQRLSVQYKAARVWVAMLAFYGPVEA